MNNNLTTLYFHYAMYQTLYFTARCVNFLSFNQSFHQSVVPYIYIFKMKCPLSDTKREFSIIQKRWKCILQRFITLVDLGLHIVVVCKWNLWWVVIKNALENSVASTLILSLNRMIMLTKDNMRFKKKTTFAGAKVLFVLGFTSL